MMDHKRKIRYALLFISTGVIAILVFLQGARSVPPEIRTMAGKTGSLRVGKEFINRETSRVGLPGKMLKTLWLFLTGTEIRRPPKKPHFRGDPQALSYDCGAQCLRLTWLGHSTVLIEIDGKKYLTDPVWSERCSPSPVIGPRRFFDPPLALDEIPRLDMVILSHDHYDHLDKKTVKALAARGERFVTPLGVGAHLRRWGIPPSRIVELDWWQSIDLGGGHRLVAAPARHFSGRGITGRNRTLWASWIVIGPSHRVFFGGDGGYQKAFREIGGEFGPFDVTMLEIGAYHPNWGDIHLGPKMALRAHEDLRGKALLPIHWGTFQLALHSWTDPVERIIPEARERGIPLLLPRPGQPVRLDDADRYSHWWIIH